MSVLSYPGCGSGSDLNSSSGSVSSSGSDSDTVQSEWTVGSLSSATCSYMFMQFTGCDQPQFFINWSENAIDGLIES